MAHKAETKSRLRPPASGCALLLAVVDTSVFINGHGVLRRLVEAMEAADDPVRSRDAPPFQLRIQLVVPFQVSQNCKPQTVTYLAKDKHAHYIMHV